MIWKVVSLLLASACITVQAASTNGAIGLDSFTFDKILAKHSQLLVKFDESFAYGEKQEVFEQLCNKSAKIPELLIGEVQTMDHGSMKNQDMDKRFKIKKSDRPTYRLFLDHSTKPIKYKGSITIAGLSNFLFEHIGVRLPLEFTLAQFDAFAVRFMKTADEEERQAIVVEAEAAKATLKSAKKKDRADMYLLMMGKIMEKGDGFVASEISRVDKLLKKGGNLSDKKKLSFTSRMNILSAFKSFEKPKDEL